MCDSPRAANFSLHRLFLLVEAFGKSQFSLAHFYDFEVFVALEIIRLVLNADKQRRGAVVLRLPTSSRRGFHRGLKKVVDRGGEEVGGQ